MGNTVEQWRASIGGWTRASLTTTTKCTGSSASPWFQLLVLVALLVIGGIEMNPGPNQAAESRYKKTVGAADMSGELFETKMSALLFLRGVNSQREFRISSNMAAAGSYDDIVFTLGQQTAFLQLKHRQNKNAKVYMSQLLTVKGDFSLLKYCKSYFDIKSQWQQNQDLQHCGRFEDSLFILFTNAKFDDNVDSNVGSNDMLDLLNTEGKLIQFTEHQHPHIYELFRSLPRYKQLLSGAVNGEQVTDKSELLQVVNSVLNNTAKCVPVKKDLAKLLADLESLGDLSGYAEFLSRLCFCTEQTGEIGLDNLIRSELKDICGNDACFDKFTLGIQNWWRKSNVYLTVKVKFFQDIIETIAANVTKNISVLKIKFKDNERDTMRHKFASGETKIYFKTSCSTLSCLKVLQSFQTNLLVDASTLQTHLNEVLSVWRLGMCDVLVVEGETTDTNTLNKLASMSDSKCVVVIASKAEHTQLYQQYKFVSFTDTFCMSQLDSDSQEEIYGHEVTFQGFPVKLNSLADASFLQTAVTADVVVQLHHTLKVGHKLDDLDPCYIHRTFLRREFVSKEIFRENNITLAVTGISEDRLAQLVPDGEKWQKFNINNFNKYSGCKYFLIEEESEFAALSRFHDNIHWIEGCAEDFHRKTSKGDVSPIIRHLEEKYINYAGVEEVLALPDHLVLIVAEPGMGKSTETHNIAHMVKEKDPSTWVVRVDLNECTTLLNDDQIDAVKFLETIATLDTEFERRLFEHELQFGGNVVILVDGFDEVSPIYSDEVFNLLEELLKNKIKHIFVTSRTVTSKELQHKLCSLSFSFHAFTPDDQSKFLVKYWNQTLKKSYNLSNFISSLLQLVGTSLNDNLREFTGIPLQCKMLAEVFQDEVSHYCETGEVRLPQSLDILQLYDKFVNKKWDVYCNKLYSGVRTVMLQQLIRNLKLQFQQSHMHCAMFSYLNFSYIKCLHSSENILRQNHEFVNRFNSGQEKTGIVIYIVEEKAVFVHRTFAEYFVAMWFSKNFKLDFKGLKQIYFDKHFEVVQKFLDRILAQEFKLHTIVLNEDLTKITHLLTKQMSDVNQKDKGGRTALHLATMNYFYRKDKINDSIVETLLEHGADVNCEDKVLHWRPLRLAEEIRAWFVVDKLLGKRADSKDLIWITTNIEKQNSQQVARIQGAVQSDSSDSECVQYRMSESLQKVMYTALCEGYVNLVEFILKCGVSATHYCIAEGLGTGTPMIHIAAEHGQLRLVQFLTEDQGVDIETCDNAWNTTPLMRAAARGHLQVAQFLLNLGASVNARDTQEHTALLFAAREGHKEIVELLVQNGAAVDICGGEHNTTPLMWAAMHGDAQLTGLFINHGSSINAIDTVGETALAKAAEKGTVEIVELLLQQGADAEISDEWDNRTPLMKAAKCGHVYVVKCLINNGACVNARDRHGDTALSLATQEGKHEIIELLFHNGSKDEISNTTTIR